MKGKPERIVHIKRKMSFHQEAQNEPEVREYFDMAYKAVGSYYKEFGKQFASGMTRAEENVLMPEMTGYYPDHDKREFRRSVGNFFRNINTKVPPEGLRLNIALENPEEPISEDNLPVNVKDYITYKHALGHPEVGESIQEAEMYQHIQFYIEDEEAETTEAIDLSKKEDEARLHYYRIIDDEDKLNHMLIMFGHDYTKMDKRQKELVLKDHATLQENKSAEWNKREMEKFTTISSDKDLQIKHDIEEMIRTDVLERIGMKILIKESGDLIGNDLKEATLWFKDKSNSKEVNVLKARYKEFGR